MSGRKKAPRFDHSPEPWGPGWYSGHYDWADFCTPDEHRFKEYQEDGKTVHVSTHYDDVHQITSLVTFEQVAGNYDYEEGGIISAADQRRIIACVNACKGIPTEELEAGELGWLLPRIRGES